MGPPAGCGLENPVVSKCTGLPRGRQTAELGEPEVCSCLCKVGGSEERFSHPTAVGMPRSLPRAPSAGVGEKCVRSLLAGLMLLNAR